MPTIALTLNGAPWRGEVRAGESLLEVLRDRCGVVSLKDGCRPQGQCGCCVAIVDGLPKTTCAIAAERADGRAVVTLEGIPAREREVIAASFQAATGLQCGFCIPGIAIRAKALLDREPEPSRERIAAALDGHLCRCTGYVKIVDAIALAARAWRGGPLPEPCTDGRVGRSLARYEGSEFTLGVRPYVADLARPGMLHGAVVLSRRARARVLAIDTAKARALPGVAVVATAADVPGERWYGLIERDWPGFVAVGEEVRCAGDVLAAVAAVDEATARAAAALVEVACEPLSPVLDPFAAMAPEAPQVNPRHPNVLSHTVVRRGDAAAALAASAHVVAGRWRTQRIEHLFLEPEAALAEPLPDGRLHLHSQGQGIFDDRRQISTFLGEPEERIHVELHPCGGAFGGKEDLSIQAHAALLARLTGRPVKLVLNREESVLLHPKRHPITLDYEVGCDAEGRLTAVRARMVGDTGAYASVGAKVLERAAGHACGSYRVPHVDVEAWAVTTNNPPCGAMRGFGANQAHFALEGALDLLAEKAGLDGWEIRWRNAIDPGDALTTGQVLTASVGVKPCLAAVRDRYYAAKRSGRAVGIACGIKNSGLGNGAVEYGRARLVVEEDGTVGLFNGFTEMGQGLLTVLVQCAVEATGLPAELFRPRVDTRYELGCGQTTGSRGTLLAGRAVQNAAAKLRADLDRGLGLADLAGNEYPGEVRIDDTVAPRPGVAGKTHTTYGFAAQLCLLDAEGRVEEIVAAHDVGRALNPKLCEGQIEGAVAMGLGYALTEELPCPEGIPATHRLRELGALRAKHMPRVEAILVEEAEPEGPFGAKGVGEIGLVPTAAAVAGALAAFDGIRRTTLPMKDSPAARAMAGVGKIPPRGEGRGTS